MCKLDTEAPADKLLEEIHVMRINNLIFSFIPRSNSSFQELVTFSKSGGWKPMNKASRGTEHIFITRLNLLPNFFTACVKICVLTHFDLILVATKLSLITQYKKNSALGGRSTQIHHFNILQLMQAQSVCMFLLFPYPVPRCRLSTLLLSSLFSCLSLASSFL